MRAPGRRLRLVAVCVATLLTVDGALAAQQVQPRSTTNPYGGLRGNSTRGLATRGASRRGISGRATARPAAPIVVVEPKEDSKARPPTPAPRGAAPKPVAARPRAPLDQFRTRLVTLKTGPILRGRARLRDGEWTVHTRDGRRTFAEKEVRRTALETEAFAMIRKRRRGMDRSDPAARLGEARWMLDLGLATEALHEMDWLLEQDDQGHGALALLTGADLSQVLPDFEATEESTEAMGQLLAFGARSSPSVQELVIIELVAHGARHRNELERMLLDEQAAIDPGRQAFAERALRRLFRARAIGH